MPISGINSKNADSEGTKNNLLALIIIHTPLDVFLYAVFLDHQNIQDI